MSCFLLILGLLMLTTKLSHALLFLAESLQGRRGQNNRFLGLISPLRQGVTILSLQQTRFAAIGGPGAFPPGSSPQLQLPKPKEKVMNDNLRFVAVVPAAFFILSGLAWAFSPGSAAASLGMTLQEGIGLSTQMGDTGALFMGGGLMIVLGIVRRQRHWFLAPAMILSFAVFYRTLATLIYGAPFAATFVAIELVTIGLLLVAANAVRT
jgi:hypothetical protein